MEKENFVDEFVDLIIERENLGKSMDDLSPAEEAVYSAARDRAYELLRPEGREITVLIRIRKYKRRIKLLQEKLDKIFFE